MNFYILRMTSDQNVIGLKSDDFEYIKLKEEAFKDRTAGKLFMKKLGTKYLVK